MRVVPGTSIAHSQLWENPSFLGQGVGLCQSVILNIYVGSLDYAE